MSRLFTWGDKAKVDERSRNSPEHAQAMMQEAASALDRKETQVAGALFTDSIAIYHARNMRREEADAYHALAQMLVTESNLSAAFDAYNQAIALYRKLNLRGQLAVTLRDAGYLCTDRGELQKAQELLNESLTLFEATGDKVGMASALEGMGIAAQDQQNSASAREYFQRSLTLHRGLELNPESAVSLIYLSIIALSQNELDTAEALYRESIDRFREDNPESSLIPPLLTLGDVAFITHESIQIGELLQAALAVFGASRLKRSWDSAMVKLGGVAQRRNVNRSALETYRHSLSVDPARDEWGSEAIACLGLGCVAYRQDKPKIGKALIARSLNLCRLNGDLDTIRYVLSYAAAYTYRCQHYPDSRQYHVQVADAARNSGDELEAADAKCYAAFLASWLGDYEEARKCCVESVAVYRTHSLHGDVARAQSLLGTVFSNLGDLETGVKIHDEAISLSRTLGEPIGIALALSNMGASLIRSDGDRALACLEESLEILGGQPAGTGTDAEVMHNMGEVDRIAGSHIDAYRLFCASLDLRLADADRFGCAASLMQAGLIAITSEQFETGATLLGKAVNIRTKLGVPMQPTLVEELTAARETLKEALGVEACARIVAEADDMSLADAVIAAHAIESLIVDPPPPEEELLDEQSEVQEEGTVEDRDSAGHEHQDQDENPDQELISP